MKRNRRAGVEDRWTRTVYVDGKPQQVPSTRNGKGMRWLARYVDDGGHEHTKAFGRKVDGQNWLNTVVCAKFGSTISRCGSLACRWRGRCDSRARG
jgi:hypothetical protein